MPDETARSTSRPVVIDLFSGAGGLSLGFEMAGFDVISAVEYDPVHAATHLYNFPLTDMLCRDVKTISEDVLIASAQRGWDLHHPDGPTWNGVVDVIVGGPSCQGFSVMGKQDVEDDRNKLVLEFVRIIEEVKPRAFCLENVPGLLDQRFAPLREEALGRLRVAGYSISGDDSVLTATDFGVPQKRRRVVILGTLNSEAPAKPTSLTGVFSVVKQALEGLPSLDGYEASGDSDLVVLTDAHRESLKKTSNPYLEAADITGDGSARFGHARILDELCLSGCRVTKHTTESTERFRSTSQGGTEPVSRAWRLSNELASRTLRAGTGRERGAFSASRPLHPTQPRVITVREGARLHSFPDWFRFHTTNWHGNRQIGNAVPPLLAAAAAAAVLESLGIIAVKSALAPMRMGDECLLSATPTEAATLLDASEDQVPRRRLRSSAKLAPNSLEPEPAGVRA